MFVERHPNFEKNGGKVSIVSHSLGCVITYDILSGKIKESFIYILYVFY